MASPGDPDATRWFDAVEFGPDRLPHPVEVVTFDDVANAAGSPRSTVSSAVGSLDRLRSLVLDRTVRSLSTDTGPGTWSALRVVVRSRDADDITGLVKARSTELAEDPALPFLIAELQAHDRPATIGAARTVIADVLASWDEVFDTALVAIGAEPDRTVAIRDVTTAAVLLAEGYRRLLGVGTHDSVVEAHLSRLAARFLLSCLTDPPAAIDPGFPGDGTDTVVLSGVTRSAVEAGAGLLLAGEIPIRTGHTIAEILEATGLSSATFYRRFGSLAEFEQRLIKHSGRRLADGFQHEFFDAMLAAVETGDLTAAEAMALFIDEAAARTVRHVEHGRPGRQAIPWLGVPAVADDFRSGFAAAFAERGEFYRRFLHHIDRAVPEPLDPATVAGVLNAYSTIGEGLLRLCRDRTDDLSYWQQISLRYHTMLLAPLELPRSRGHSM